MTWEAWTTLAVIALMIVALVRNWAGTDLVLLGAMTVLTSLSAVSAKFPSASDAVRGFGNEALMTVVVLFVVVAGLSQTGAMAMLTQPLLGRPASVLSAQVRLMFPVATLSAFLNNTPIVAMFMPVVSDWCKKSGLSPSKLFIPLSFATILGGVCTLIGTSTNMVVNGLWIADTARSGGKSLGLFDIAWVGIPVAAVGLAYLLIVSRWLLPERKAAVSIAGDPREYTIEMLVEPGSPLVGRTIEQAGLRHLPGTYLMEIGRGSEVLPAVSAKEKLEANDRLVFVGVVESVVDLQKIRGLKPATDQVFKLDSPRAERVLVEAVVSNSCPLVGRSIREGRFRAVYDAAVIAVARNGERLRMKIGDIVLAAGDTLLLESHASFAEKQRNSRDFFLVSAIEGSTPPLHDKALVSLIILLAMVVVAGFEWLSMLQAALLAAGLMLMTRCCTVQEARRSIDWEVFLAIGASLGIGRALDTTGAASAVGQALIGAAGGNPWVALVVVYAVTITFTELMSNNAAAALLYPIAIATASSMSVDGNPVNPMPFVVAIMVAASCGFATPIGYQTHMMVYGPGGYKFTDFTRIGLPLDILCGIVCVIVAPLVWPF